MRFLKRLFRRRTISIDIEELHYAGNAMDITAAFPETALIGKALAKVYETVGGPNYVEMSAMDKEHGRVYTMTIQPKERPTPAEITAALRAALQAICKHPEQAQKIAREALRKFGYLEEE